MADNEAKSPKQNKDGAGDITPSTYLKTEQASDSGEVDTRDGADGTTSNEGCGDNSAAGSGKPNDATMQESKNASPDISPKASPHQPDNPPSGEVKDKENLNSSTGVPPLGDKDKGGADGTTSNEERGDSSAAGSGETNDATMQDMDYPSNKTEVDTPDGADGTTSNEGCGDNSAVGSGKTNDTTMQESKNASPDISPKASPHQPDNPPSGEVKDKENLNSSTGDPPPGDKDKGGADGTTSNKERGDNSAAGSGKTSKIAVQEAEANNQEPTSTSDVSPSVKDDEENGESTAYQKLLSQQNPAEQNGQEKDVKPEPTPAPDPPRVKDNTTRNLWIGVGVAGVAVVLAAVLLQHLFESQSPPQIPSPRQIDIFHQEMEKVKVKFPSQREDLWKRSRIHLRRHFLISQQTEPVSIILTAGKRAEVTLRCLAQSIASALSSALNVSAIHINGTSKSSQDSDKVKSDIDSQLQGAFEGGKPIAVIHRFEELPPASTLIFYRYCDHENAAFKETFLIFTVLLEEEEEIQTNIRLREIEEMVTDHLQKKFLSDGHPTSFDKMDIDKYGGLWSRISHLILPVVTEKENCKN